MPVWVPGGTLTFDGRVQRGNLHLRPERRLHEADRHFAKQIVAVALEDRMGLDVQHDVQIARRAAPKARFPVAGGTQAEPGVHAGGDSQRDL